MGLLWPELSIASTPDEGMDAVLCASTARIAGRQLPCEQLGIGAG